MQDMDGPSVLADAAIIPYPRPDSDRPSTGKATCTQECREKIDDQCAEAVRDAWRIWNLDQKRYFHGLTALQRIKGSILRDKLFLTKHALKAFVPPYKFGGDQGAVSTWSRFLLVRGAVLARATEYVEFVGDLQAQFGRSMDIALQDGPRPQLERRREQGLYTSFLADRCRDLNDEIARLLVDGYQVAPKDVETVRQQLTMHRWSHDFSSRVRVFHDSPSADAAHTERSRSVTFINTSYWMTDRPDLQSVISHEVAHGAMESVYAEFRPDSLLERGDAFALMMSDLGTALHIFGVEHRKRPLSQQNRPSHLLPEIGADLLAAAVQGHEYLTALFLELFGQGLEHLFKADTEEINLGRAELLQGRVGLVDLEQSWYLRLHLLCTWVEQVHHHDPHSALDTAVVKGVRSVLDGFMDYLESLQYQDPYDGREHDLYRVLTRRMCDIVRDSKAAGATKRWRKARADDAQPGGPRLLPRHTRRLDEQARDFLFRKMLAGKKLRVPTLRSTATRTDLIEAFDHLYLGPSDHGKGFSTPACNDTPWLGRRPLFYHYYDIPWQCALMRMQEFREQLPREGWNEQPKAHDLLEHLCCDTALGRELYHIAIELYFHNSRSALWRMELAIRFLSEAIDNFRQPKTHDLEDLVSAIDRWLRGSPGQNTEVMDEAVATLTKRYVEADNAIRAEFYELSWECVHQFSAEAWLAKHASSGKMIEDRWRANRTRVVEKLQGYKLKQLQDLLDKQLPSCRGLCSREQDLVATLRIICGFLRTRPLHEPIMRTLTGALTPSRSQENDLVNHELMVVGRISASGSYHLRALSQQEQEPSLSRLWALPHGQGPWNIRPTICRQRRAPVSSKEPVSDPPQSGELRTRYKLLHGILGRYDIVSLLFAKPMCRYDLPVFGRAENNGSNGVQVPTADDECFPSFFVRRELAIPVRLDLNKDSDLDNGDNDNPRPIIGVLAVSLTHRQARLDMIYRLVSAVTKYHEEHSDVAATHTSDSGARVPTIDDVARDFCPDDCLLLTDGWGDLLIFFGREMADKGTLTDEQQKSEQQKLDKQRLEQAFRIKNALLHDILVDRTELVLAPSMLAVAARNSEYRIEMRVRLVEQRSFRYTMTSLMDRIRENGKDERWQPAASPNPPSEPAFVVLQTPGRTDVTIKFADLSKYKIAEYDLGLEDIAQQLFELKVQGTADLQADIDLTITTIGQVHS
ncbi:MAG: hypothetical protein N838_02440 [Thiohalocapsa sp. PB-PSB1]|jgi:hypothetical protein|nr:MAG: hypothetical protein N838_02440 [Thiohalocapsa sp. PB-PSB1]HCS89715.1 hypothetical protein [Chromatiaceae bacterium]